MLARRRGEPPNTTTNHTHSHYPPPISPTKRPKGLHPFHPTNKSSPLLARDRLPIALVVGPRQRQPDEEGQEDAGEDTQGIEGVLLAVHFLGLWVWVEVGVGVVLLGIGGDGRMDPSPGRQAPSHGVRIVVTLFIIHAPNMQNILF